MRITMSLKEAAPSVIPEGVYVCECLEVKDLRTISGQNGEVEVLDLRWKILEGTDPAGVGRTFQDTYFLDGNSLWRVSLLMQQVLGLKKDDLPELQTTEEIHDYLASNVVGSRATITLSVFAKDGTERNRVRKIVGA